MATARTCSYVVEADERLQNSVLHECNHPFLRGQALHLRRFGTVLDQVSQFIRSAQEFVQGDPTLRPVWWQASHPRPR